MKLVVDSRLRIEKDIIIKVQRMLQGQGKIFVNVGREVSPEEIIGTSELFSGFRILNLASALSVKPSEVTKYMKINVGQRIYKDELLAFKKGGFFSPQKVITSPTDGILDFVNTLTGEIRLSRLPKKIELAAGVYGIVEKVDTNLGVIIIRAQVSKIHGVMGTGRIREGTLKILTKRDGVISKQMIQSGYEGYVLVGGSLSSNDVLRETISSGVNGIIVGGINASDFKTVVGNLSVSRKLEYDTGISLVICEGFGAIGLGEDIMKILQEYDGRFVSVEGDNAAISLPSFSSSSMIRVRNTQLPQTGEEKSVGSQKIQREIYEGVRVRIVGSSFTGEQGKVLSVDKTESLMASGIKSYMVTIETKRRKIQVSYKNIEII